MDGNKYFIAANTTWIRVDNRWFILDQCPGTFTWSELDTQTDKWIAELALLNNLCGSLPEYILADFVVDKLSGHVKENQPDGR